MKLTLNHILIVIIIVLLGFNFVKGCNNPFAKEDTNDVVKVDSTKITKVIPEQQGKFVVENPTPERVQKIYINNPSKNTDLQNVLLQLIEQSRKDNESNREAMKELVNALSKKSYKEVKEDSIIKATINTVVEDGKQTSLSFDYTIKESAFDYYKVETETKMYPDYTLSLGAGITTNLSKPLIINSDILDNVTIPTEVTLTGLIGYKNKKGNEIILEAGINKDIKLNSVSVKYKKDILTKF